MIPLSAAFRTVDQGSPKCCLTVAPIPAAASGQLSPTDQIGCGGQSSNYKTPVAKLVRRGPCTYLNVVAQAVLAGHQYALGQVGEVAARQTRYLQDRLLLMTLVRPLYK